ncbi:MAG: hypothetical protein AAFO96_29220, partial [Bacteroidota bacterium]
LYGVLVVALMPRITNGEMYNTLEGWDYGEDYTHNRDYGGAVGVLQEDVETVLGLQVVVKSMLDDVIGGQHAQKEQLSSILGSSVLTFNRSTEPPQTTPSTTPAQRNTNMEILEELVEELQRNSTQGTTSRPTNTTLSSSSTPQTTQTQTSHHRSRLPNKFFSQEEGAWFARRSEDCENGAMPIMEVHERFSSSRVENVVALKGYSGQKLCYFVTYWERFVCRRPNERLRRPGYYFVCKP